MCGISGLINLDGTRENGEKIVKMITVLRDRENGLGAGFALYGLFPDLADYYCLNFHFDSTETKEIVEEYLKRKGEIIKSEPVPVDKSVDLPDQPISWRIFFDPAKSIPEKQKDDYIISVVMHINDRIPGAFCISSGKDMAVFKGNSWSDDIAKYYMIEKYKAYMFLAHSRFPTNTPGSPAGAHPFNILGTSVVHNGEITSYGTNRRYLEIFGYKCTMQTDTEVIAYLFDLLVRRHKIPLPIATIAFNPPLHDKIDLMPRNVRMALKAIRITYRSAMLNGPFSIIVGMQLPEITMIGLTDRKKLRPQVAALSDDGNTLMISSEEASMKALVLDPRFDIDYHKVWMPKAGSPVIAQIGKGIIRYGNEDPFEGFKLELNED